MQKSMSATKDSCFGKIGYAQGFMGDTCTGLFTSQQTNKTVPEMADTANLDSWSLSHLGYLYPGTTPVMIKLDESLHGVTVVVPTNHREIPGSIPGRYDLQIKITSNLMPPSHDKDGGGGGSRNNHKGEILDLMIFLKNPCKSV